MDTASFKEHLTSAIRYWEPGRIVYNLVLAGIVIGYFLAYLPGSKQLINFDAALLLFVLAVLANVAYCSAYIVDVFAQSSGFREDWQRYRWLLLLVGILFASALTRWLVIGMFSNAG